MQDTKINDLTKRLRQNYRLGGSVSCVEAADEIERLTKQNEELRNLAQKLHESSMMVIAENTELREDLAKEKDKNENLRQGLFAAIASSELWLSRYDQLYVEHTELHEQHERNTNVVVRLSEEIAALQRKDEELRVYLAQARNDFAELAALKPQSAETETECWKCGEEDGGTSCGDPHCGLVYDEPQESTEQPVAGMLCYQGQMPYFVQDESEIPDDEYVAVAPLYLHPPKQESTEPVAWFYEQDGYVYSEYDGPIVTTTRWASFSKESWTETPLYTTPPSTRAAVEAFKKRCVEVCMDKAKSVTQLNFAGGCEWCAEAIEALPLIQGAEHDRTD